MFEINNDRRKQDRRKSTDRRTNKLEHLFEHAVEKGVFLNTRKGQRRKGGDRRKGFDPTIYMN